MNENEKSRSGLQTAVDFAHAARAAKRIMQAAAASGVHGAAAATAREAFPLLLKVLIAVLVVFIAVPMVIFTALPNIFFGYNSSGTDTVIQMTQQAMTLGGVYMTLGNFEGAQIDSVVTGIAAEYEKNGTTIDHIVVSSAICLLCGGNRLPPHRGGQRTPKLFLCRIWRKDSFGVRRNKGGGAAGVLFSVRDVDVLRLLCWCQNIRPQDLNSISTKVERENLMALGFIKLHERSGTLTLTGSGRAFLELIFNGAIPSLSLSYHGAAIERRIRLSRLMLSAYQAGIDVFASEVNVAREIPSLFLTSITRTRGRNSWGSSRVAAIVSLGGIYYAAHYVCPGIGRMAVNDELAAFHNHTNFGKNTQRAFLFAGSSYESVIEELKNQDEKRNERLIRYGEAYHCLHAPIHLLSCDETGAQQLQIMTVPDYRVKLTRLMLRSAYQPPPEDIAAWDGLYNGHPFVIGADMDLRRIDTAVRTAEQHGCLPIALAALEGQGSAVLLQRYADPGCATVYKVTENVLSELLGRAPNLYVPPRTQFLTEKGDVVDAPLIKTPGKAGGPHRK